MEAALAVYVRGRGDVADHLIREAAPAADCDAVATFDRKLLSEPGFVHPDPGQWDDTVSLDGWQAVYVPRRGRARRYAPRRPPRAR